MINGLKYLSVLSALLCANALAGNGGGMEPPGDVYSCIQENRYYLIGTESIEETFVNIEKNWACLPDDEQALCKEVVVIVARMHKEGHSEKNIQNTIYAKGAWTAGLCK